MFRQIVFHPATAMFITLVVALFWVSMIRSQLRFRQAEEPLQQLEKEIAGLESEVTDLETELRIASSAATKERIARNDLLLKRPGEYVIYIENFELPTEASSSADTKTPWESWKQLLFHEGEETS